MTEKNLIVGVIVVLVFGAAVFGLVSKFQSGSTEPDPTPASNNLLNQNTATGSSKPMQEQKMKQYEKFPGVLPNAELQGKKAVIQTQKGNIEFEIYTDAPKAASNFIFLVDGGFYNGLTFHRVEPGFVIQGGDPMGNGTGGPGYQFEDEKVTKPYSKGIVAMANAGPNTNGSQFFITLADLRELPSKYTIFGKVISGIDVVEKIKVGDIMSKVTIEPLN